jgi:hypothetical protein
VSRAHARSAGTAADATPTLGHFQVAYSREQVSLDRLLEILSTQARGAERAIKARNLVAPLGLGRMDSYPDRTIRAAVRELVRRGYPIGSLTGEDSGYFYIVDRYELLQCTRNLEARASATLGHAEDLRRAFYEGPRQGGLFTGLA